MLRYFSLDRVVSAVSGAILLLILIHVTRTAKNKMQVLFKHAQSETSSHNAVCVGDV